MFGKLSDHIFTRSNDGKCTDSFPQFNAELIAPTVYYIRTRKADLKRVPTLSAYWIVGYTSSVVCMAVYVMCLLLVYFAASL
jgi:hypothetical protein